MNVKSTISGNPYSCCCWLALARWRLRLLRGPGPADRTRRRSVTGLRGCVLATLPDSSSTPASDETPEPWSAPSVLLLDTSEHGTQVLTVGPVVQTVRDAAARDVVPGQSACFRSGHLAAVDADFGRPAEAKPAPTRARRRAGRRASRPTEPPRPNDSTRPGASLEVSPTGSARPASGRGRLFRRPRPRPGSR